MRLDARVDNGRRVIEGWDRVFEVLAAEPRRQLVVSLLDAPSDGTVPLPESAVNPNVPADPDVLRRELHHHHLPMLADRGFVEWDVDPLVAARGPKFDEVGVVMETLQTSATDVPDSLVIGCQRLEAERQAEFADTAQQGSGSGEDGRKERVRGPTSGRDRADGHDRRIDHRTGPGAGLGVRPSLGDHPRDGPSAARRDRSIRPR